MQIGRWALPAQNKPMNAWQIALDYDCAVCSEIFSHYINKPAICNLPWPHKNRFYFTIEIRHDHASCNIFRQHSISYSMKRLPHAIEIVKVTSGNRNEVNSTKIRKYRIYFLWQLLIINSREWNSCVITRASKYIYVRTTILTYS